MLQLGLAQKRKGGCTNFKISGWESQEKIGKDDTIWGTWKLWILEQLKLGCSCSRFYGKTKENKKRVLQKKSKTSRYIFVRQWEKMLFFKYLANVLGLAIIQMVFNSDIYLHLSVSPIRFPARTDFLITFLRSIKPPLSSQSWTKLGHLWRHLPRYSLGSPHGLCLFLYKNQSTSKMKCFSNIFNGYKSLPILVKRSILVVWHGSE